MRRTVLTILGAGLVMAVGAQDEKKEPHGQMKPTKEHEWLRQFEGMWQCTSEFKMEKDGRTEKGKGTETDRLELGGFWLMQDFKGEADGKPFQGHGMIGYDPGRKKYVYAWVNSMSPCWFHAEGDADTDGKTFTFRGEGVDPASGKTSKHRVVHQFKDQNTRVMTFYAADEQGTERKVGDVFCTRGLSK